MEPFKRIAILDSAVEAEALRGEFEAREIPHIVHSYHDYALDGIFAPSKGWGEVRSAEEHEREIVELLEDMRRGRTS